MCICNCCKNCHKTVVTLKLKPKPLISTYSSCVKNLRKGWGCPCTCSAFVLGEPTKSVKEETPHKEPTWFSKIKNILTGEV